MKKIFEPLLYLLLVQFGLTLITSCSQTSNELYVINGTASLPTPIPGWIEKNGGIDLETSSGILSGNDGAIRYQSETTIDGFVILDRFASGQFTFSIGGPPPGDSIMTVDQDGFLIIKTKDRELMRYRVNLMYPPAGVDSMFKRNAYLHPVYTPHGQLLTRIQPEDHYHHYGIWNPWTHTLYKGDTLDFWNLYQKQGTVRHAKTNYVVNGPAFTEFQVLHEHVVLKDGRNEVALNETQTIRTYYPDKDFYIMDLTINYECATDAPFKIIEYRYGGLGWRATEEWHKGNSKVLTSEDIPRQGSDGSLADWVIASGELGDDYGGIMIMSHPDNYNHPQPLRIWPEGDDRGDLFVNFAPTKNMDWEMIPGQQYALKYRFVFFNGELSKDMADPLYSAYVNPPKLSTNNE